MFKNFKPSHTPASSNWSSGISRRGALAALTTTVGGSLLARSIATGIPAHILANPLEATAQDMPSGKFLILNSRNDGDPINCYVPGTYGHDLVVRSADASMAETPMQLGSVSTSGAAVWANLPQDVLNKSVFFHHATYTPVHGELGRVQTLMESTEQNDMLVSLLSRELAPTLGTVQSDPVSLGAGGSELLRAEGRTIGNVAPLSVRDALGGIAGALKDVTQLRDNTMDEIYRMYRDQGNAAQRTLLDAWARSRDEVRNVSDVLVSRLDALEGNGQDDQVRCAAVLAAMKITPVVTVNINFGADNHSDAGLVNETEKHQTGMASVQILMDELAALRSEGVLQHEVVFGSLNVFGRTFFKKGDGGRDHHAGHHAMVMIGEGLNPGIVGGIELNESGRDYIAQSIDSETGAGGGDISFEETLGAAGKTLGAALGVSEERMDEMVTPGKVVRSVIA